MAPNDRPANENEGPEPLWENTPLGRRVMGVVSAVVIVGGVAFIWLFATPATLRTIGIGLVLIFACAIVAALYRLIVHGRA